MKERTRRKRLHPSARTQRLVGIAWTAMVSISALASASVSAATLQQVHAHSSAIPALEAATPRIRSGRPSWQQQQQQQGQQPQDRRRGEAGTGLFPQNIVRLQGTPGTGSQDHQRGINAPMARPTPSPVATPAPFARPTPHPVGQNNNNPGVTATTNTLHQQSTVVPGSSPEPEPKPHTEGGTGQSQPSLPPSFPPLPVSPWRDKEEEGDVDFDLEFEPVEESTLDGNNDDNNNDGLPDAEDETDDETDEPADVCGAIGAQNHTAILAKQQAGTAGPSFLYALTVSVVHEETLSSSEIAGALEALNAPMALSIADCPQADAGTRHRNRTRKTRHRRAQSQETTPVVEYSEVEAWKETTSSECSWSSPTEDLVCGVYRTRVIAFLVDDAQVLDAQEDWEGIFFQKINVAILRHYELVTDAPGIASMEIEDLRAIAMIPAGSGSGGGPTTNPRTPNASVNSSTTRLIGAEEGKLIVYFVAAGVGGLLFGMIFLVWSRSSPRCAGSSSKEHSRFDEDEEDLEERRRCGSKKRKNKDNNNDNDDGFPRSSTNLTYNLEDEEGFHRTLSHRGRSDRGIMVNRVNSLNSLNRVNSLLDKDADARKLSGTKTGRTVSWEGSFDDEYEQRFETENPYEEESPLEFCVDDVACCTDERPCSSATCQLCAHRRERGLDRGEYLWLKELMPSSPSKVPSFDPSRPCLCSDTVVL